MAAEIHRVSDHPTRERKSGIADRGSRNRIAWLIRPLAWLRLAKLRLALRNGKFDAADADRFMGITASSSVKDVQPPDIDRYNDTVKMLREEKAADAERKLATAFFARNLALGLYDISNFDGFARSRLQTNDAPAASACCSLL